MLNLYQSPAWEIRNWDLKVEGFAPKVSIRIDRDPYVVKTVDHAWELQQALALRYEVFHREYRGATEPTGFDIDSFDFGCDHLVILSKETGRVLGTYRLISSCFSDRFYSEGEFELASFLALPGGKLELGRACVHKDHRTGAVMTLLWRGLSEYIRKTQARYLFGCSSVKSLNPIEISAVSRYLQEEGVISQDLEAPVRDAYRIEGLDLDPEERPMDASELSLARFLIPQLLVSYIKAGAKIYGGPAGDREFRCTDYFTVLQTDRLTEFYQRRYRL